MLFRPASVMATMLLVGASLANAEATLPGTSESLSTEASPSADLAIIEGRLAKRPELLPFWDRMREAVSQDTVLLSDFVVQNLGRLGQIDGDSIPYRLAGQVEAADRRADRYASIIANDLDGDGSVAREEIAAALSYGQSRRQGAAEALISFDADMNDKLSPDEITAAARAAREGTSGQNTDMALAEILDLDDDGVLTRDELARVEAALHHAAGQ